MSLPFLILALLHPAGSTYTGVLVSPLDTYSYIGQMLHSRDGQWLFRDSFTHLDLPPIWIYSFYTFLGKVTPASAIPGGPGALLLLARLGFTILFIQQAWRLFGEVLPGRGTRRVALLFLLFTSGLGLIWLLIPETIRGSTLPYDLRSPQSSTYFTLLEAPHYVAEMFLAVVFLRVFYAGMTGDRRRRLLLVGGATSFAISLIHPEKIAVLAITCGLFLAWTAATRMATVRGFVERCAWAAALLLPGIPYVVYVAVLSRYNAVIQLQSAPGTVPGIIGNPVIYLVIGYGIPGLCAMAAVYRMIRHPRRADPGLVLLAAFAAGGLTLVQFNRGWSPAHGTQIAISGLAAAALVRQLLPWFWRTTLFRRLVGLGLKGYDRRRLRTLSLNLVLIASAPTMLGLVVATPAAAHATVDSYYVNTDDQAALGWMHAHVPPDDVVAATPESAQFVVAYGGARVSFGDSFLTPDYTQEGRDLSDFFAARGDQAGYLRSHMASWLYFGPREARVALFDPSKSPMFQSAFTTGSTVIYRVALPAGS